jgi:outer membrane scaffolding protein for murein synthesis (MipA/OmpV family)
MVCQTQFIRSKVGSLVFKFCAVFTSQLLLLLASLPCSAQSDDAPVDSSPNRPNQTDQRPTQWSYVIGARASYAKTDLSSKTSVAPVIGLRYGRFRLGLESNANNWLAVSVGRREPSLSYDVMGSQDWRATLGLRIQNVSQDSDLEVLAAGKRTLRGRLGLSYTLSENWLANGELTYDLLKRGDGTTATIGLSRLFVLSPKSGFSITGSTTWADRTHWRTITSGNANGPDVRTGLGLAQLSVGYRHAMSTHWAWFASATLTKPVGTLANLPTVSQRNALQVGLLYFSGPQTRSY